MNTNNQETNLVTKEAIETALLQLLDQQSIETISITELTQYAGVSRMAYYRNYDSIQDIFRNILDRYFNQILAHDSQLLVEEYRSQFWAYLFQFIYDQRETMSLIFKPAHHAMILTYLNQRLQPHHHSAREFYTGRAMIGLFFNVLQEWVAQDFDLSVEELSNLCDDLTNPSTELPLSLVNSYQADIPEERQD